MRPDKPYLSSPPRIDELPEPPPSDEPSSQESIPKVDLGIFTVTMRDGSRKGSTERPPSNGDEGTPPRKKSRVSVLSNISNRFRKSMDFDSMRDRDDALRLVRERSSSSSERVSSEDRDINGGECAEHS